MNELEHSVCPKNSTSVRAFYTGHLLRLAGKHLPDRTAQALASLFLTPQRPNPTARPASLGEALRLEVPGVQPVRAFVAGEGPVVLLSHGWSGGSAGWAALRRTLLGAGFRVAWFDAPAHGGHPARRAHIGQFVHCLQELTRQLGTPSALVGHSLGGLAAALALAAEPAATQLVLLAPLPSFDFALDHFQAALGFGTAERLALVRHLERLTGLRCDDVTLDRALESSTLPTLLVHDQDDRRIPASWSRQSAERMRGVEYVETRCLGHARLLADPAVLDCIVEFLSGRPARSLTPG